MSPDPPFATNRHSLKAFDDGHLRDVWRGRVDYPTLKAKVKELAQEFGADEVLMEDAGSGTFLVEELKGKVRGLIPVKPDRDKQTRMAAASAKFEAGQVFLLEGASWLADLEAELLAFPGSRYDDQVDSVSQALNHRSGLASWAGTWPPLPPMPGYRLRRWRLPGQFIP